MATLLVLGQSHLIQGQLGIGLVDVNFDDKTVIHFHEQPKTSPPVRTIRFFDDKSINAWNIVDLESVRKWLSPESIWLDYHSFVFRCLSKRSGWLQVLVNDETGKSYWIRASPQLTFKTWEEFLKGMFSITRSREFPQKLRARPSARSREVKYRGKDCFDVISMSGDWIKVKQAGHCEVRDASFRSGWIRWRRDATLQIGYFITS